MTEATTQNRRLGILEMAGKTEGLAQDQLANVWKVGEDLEVGADWENLAGLGTFSALIKTIITSKGIFSKCISNCYYRHNCTITRKNTCSVYA